MTEDEFVIIKYLRMVYTIDFEDENAYKFQS